MLLSNEKFYMLKKYFFPVTTEKEPRNQKTKRKWS